jgi:chaperonin GroEL (HSP60 family)
MALWLPKLESDERVTIVRRACEEPVRQIVLNCGTEGASLANLRLGSR